MQPSNNIAARVGRWSAQHRKTAVFGWLAFVIAAFVIGSFMIGSNTLSKEEGGVGESGRADMAAYKAFPKKAGESVFIHSDKLKADSPQFHAAVTDVMRRLDSTKGVQNVTGPYAAGGNGVSPGQALRARRLRAAGRRAGDQDHHRRAVGGRRCGGKAHPALEIDTFGSASTEKEFMREPSMRIIHKARVDRCPLALASCSPPSARCSPPACRCCWRYRVARSDGAAGPASRTRPFGLHSTSVDVVDRACGRRRLLPSSTCGAEREEREAGGTAGGRSTRRRRRPAVRC